jgi:large subunit ribosomal protein L25
MSTETVVGVAARQDSGKNVCRRLRREGNIPGIVYGMDLDPFAVTVSERTINDVLSLKTGRNTIFTLSLEGSDKKSTREVMIKDLQRDPVTERLVHVDFIRVDMQKAVTVGVPIRLVGTPEGVKNEGGLIDFIQRQVMVECLPDRIPEQIDLDVSELHLNQNALIKDLQEVEGVEILDDPDSPVMGVIAPRGLEVEEAAAEEEVEEGEEAAEDKEEEGAKEAGESKEEGSGS